MKVDWRPMAHADRASIMEYIGEDNPSAALELDSEFEAKAELARQNPKLYKPGRMRGTREIVVRPSYVMIYRVKGNVLTVLRVMHTARQWPPAS